MKKILLGLCAISLFGFTGCADILDILLGEGGSSSSAYDTVTATETVSKTYGTSTDAFNVFEVAPKTKTLSISDVPTGKAIYFAKVNKGKSTVALNDTRCIVSTSSGYRAAADESALLENAVAPATPYKHFRGEEITLESAQAAARSARATTSTELTKATQISREVGTKKNDLCRQQRKSQFI